ncbi:MULTISPECIES: hypothetical protein [unclassified Streptomyces]|uniref:hypothetical protein n=1 Tax=unclassified Streptomyces TaxID=2593676 RepID=UPI000DC57F9D|nr:MULTISPECIES: hypothetical protein [unclassified Streptomyces]RAJ78818.1 hypothetical protein K377_05424 [Streptomyces sp. PsTaAH-137]
MRTIKFKTSLSGDAAHLLMGAGAVAAGAGLVLALTHTGSPLRGPLTLFFLLAAPGSAFAAALRGLDTGARVLVSAAGAVCVVMLVAQGMLATHHWSVDGGVVAVGALTAAAFLLQLAYRKGRHKVH